MSIGGSFFINFKGFLPWNHFLFSDHFKIPDIIPLFNTIKELYVIHTLIGSYKIQIFKALTLYLYENRVLCESLVITLCYICHSTVTSCSIFHKKTGDSALSNTYSIKHRMVRLLALQGTDSLAFSKCWSRIIAKWLSLW